jgi:diguanylate cyclase (GGDEF)-like protein
VLQNLLRTATERRYLYAVTAGVLSTSAPAGLMGMRLAKRARTEIPGDRVAAIYLAAATAAIFAGFGYMLGRRVDRLEALSETDSLTGLLNARGFAGRLHAELKRATRYREPLTLMFLDLDGLKAINDRFGHRAGSDALVHVADVIQSELRESDSAARWGGDEFTILAPNTPPQAALTLAERIRSRVEDHRRPFAITASIGIASQAPNGSDGKPLDDGHIMRAADTAMYEAKKRGRNTVYQQPWIS